MTPKTNFAAVCSLLLVPAHAAVLYTSPGPIAIDESGSGSNLAGLSLSRSTTATDSLYFRFTLSNLLSNSTNENYYAAFQFFDGGAEKLGLGNAWDAYAYSAFNTAAGNLDLKSATPEAGVGYQLVRAADSPITIAVQIDFVNGGNDNVTVWLAPDFNLTTAAQATALTTTFAADVTFSEIHLREGGGGGGWTYSDIRVANSAAEIGFIPEPSVTLLGGISLLGLLRRRR